METSVYDKQKVDRIFKMIDRDGFVELFNQALKIACKNNERLTHKEAFNQLNDEYFEYTKKYRYDSFESFKKTLYHQ